MVSNIDLLVKFIILILLNVETELFLRNKSYHMAILVFAVWLMMFRTTLLRAIAMYVGVFSYQPQSILEQIRSTLQSAESSLILDTVLLIGVIAVFNHLKKNFRKS